MRKILLLIVFPFLLTGCGASTYNLTVNTFPSGATLYNDSTQIGVSPVVLTYQNNSRFKVNNCLQIQGYKAVWMSGAQSETEQIVTLCGAPGSYNLMIRRPEEPGFDQDLQYADRLEAQRAQERARMMQGMQNTIQGLQGPLYQLGRKL